MKLKFNDIRNVCNFLLLLFMSINTVWLQLILCARKIYLSLQLISTGYVVERVPGDAHSQSEPNELPSFCHT